MRSRAKLMAAGLGLACSAVLTPVVVAAPASAAGHGAQPAYSCTIDSLTHVKGVDWLRVHTTPSVSAPTVGLLPNRAAFNFCGSSVTHSGGYYWIYGYGYHGSARLTGWIDSEYTVGP